MHTPPFLCARCRMSEERKASPSRQVLKIPPLARADIPAVANVRTLQDVQRDIQKESMRLAQARGRYEYALWDYDTARTASSEDPNNKILSEKLADTKESRDAHISLMDISARLLAKLDAEKVGLHAAANISSAQYSKFYLS